MTYDPGTTKVTQQRFAILTDKDVRLDDYLMLSYNQLLANVGNSLALNHRE
jgi:hypothetical protein